MTVNERIREVRKSHNLTMDKFGERIKISKVSVSRIESGINNPSDQTLSLICREFNICEEWLLNGTGPMHPEIDEDVEYGQICAELGITDKRAKQIIINYGKFSDEDKELFWSFIDRLRKE